MELRQSRWAHANNPRPAGWALWWVFKNERLGTTPTAPARSADRTPHGRSE